MPGYVQFFTCRIFREKKVVAFGTSIRQPTDPTFITDVCVKDKLTMNNHHIVPKKPNQPAPEGKDVCMN